MKNEVANSAPGAAATAGRPALLIVDDDPLITDTLAFALGTDYEVLRLRLAPRTRSSWCASCRRAPQLALVDLGLPPAPHSPDEGFRLIGDLLAHSPRDEDLRALRAERRRQRAPRARARRLGVHRQAGRPARALARAARARRSRRRRPRTSDFVGASPALAKLKSQIAQFAAAPYPVLIEGESGSGKELVALRLHRLSPRARAALLQR